MFEQSVRPLRIAVAVATTGRASLLRDTIPSMLDQSRRPERLIVVAVTPTDVEGVSELDPGVEVVFGARGSATQRNVALALVKHECDVIVFFDDDFIPCRDFIARVEEFFMKHADVAAVTGQLVIDGVNHGGCELEVARGLIRSAEQANASSDSSMREINHLYGCNMAARMPMAADIGFDERLPLYAWQEDRDFSRRLSEHGRIVRSNALWGAHLGVTQGRSRGVRLGYSQVANPAYLLAKGTMRPVETAVLVGRNVAANVVKTLNPEPWIDRAGRLKGNLLALADVARGRLTPERILEL